MHSLFPISKKFRKGSHKKKSSASDPSTKRGEAGPLREKNFFEALKTLLKKVPMTTKLEGEGG